MFGDLRFCKTPELIENFEKAAADNFIGWDCHHRLETHFSDGTERPKNAQLSAAELKALDMYYKSLFYYDMVNILHYITLKEYLLIKQNKPFQNLE